MALDPIDVIRRFEPILHFHSAERFFPSDAKRYFEHCALWRVQGSPRDSQGRWGGVSRRTLPHFPLINRGKIVVLDGEPPVIGENVDGQKGKALGEPGFNLGDSSDEERFLDLSGWIGGDAVDAGSSNRYADLDGIFNAYNGGVTALADSRFWYHAEVFTASRLRGLLVNGPPIDFDKFTRLKDPAFVCYYLFFPGHEEPLEGCPDSDLAKRWASCAGAWACVAILLDGDGNQSNYKPTMLGLTTRNAGMVQFLGQELRVGMRVFDWLLASKVEHDRGPNREAGQHPRIFVSRGAHGLTLDQAVPPALTKFSPDDYSQFACGQYETHAGQVAANQANEAVRTEQERLALLKIVAGAIGGFHAMGGFLNPTFAGVLGGAIGTIPEVLLEFRGVAGVADLQPPPPVPPPQFDHPPGVGEIGIVIHPVDVDPPAAPLDTRRVWPRLNKDDPNDDRTLVKMDDDGRTYSLWVANAAAPDSRPIWLPSEEPTTPSFRGRWGNRVASDPFNRRVGMRFPNFWALFFEGIGM
jgi:hypothetical protein